jgi:hypothetical protein
VRPGNKIVTSPRAMWAVWTSPGAEADMGPVIAWTLDDHAGTLAPLVLGIEDQAAHPLAAGSFVALHDDRLDAELAWQGAMRDGGEGQAERVVPWP